MNNVLRAYTKKVTVLAVDMLLVICTLPISLIIRLDLEPAIGWFKMLYPYYYMLAFVCFLLSFVLFRTYRTILRLANLSTALRVGTATFVGGCLFYFSSAYIFKLDPVPRSLFLIQMLLLAPGCLSFRFSLRIIERLVKRESVGLTTLIYGGGLTTDRLLPMLLQSEEQFNLIGIIDDDPSKKGCDIQGIRVLGNSSSLPRLIEKLGVEQVILSMPSLPGKRLREIVDKYHNLNVKFKILPNPGKYFTTSDIEVKDIRDLNIEDLLKRPPRKIDAEAIEKLIKGRVVVVTGGGGSIGSELVRQIAQMSPRKLIVNDASEFSLYSINEEIQSNFPQIEVVAHLGNIADKYICSELFSGEKIDIIFHACAYKHVPIVENNIVSAVRNNLLSAMNVFEEACKIRGVRVVLISSDKAVRPTNVMGATKRVCELLALRYAEQARDCAFTCVRFGNVLGSSGSVIPKFLEQIKAGGPVTVTHPDITRFFMLIPEAVSLVLQASISSQSGEIFILNMGEPVKILDVAKTLIRLSGKRENKDIKIVFSGLRPGEKMYEELQLDNEKTEVVSEDFFKVNHNLSLGNEFDRKIDDLLNAAMSRNAHEAKVLLFKLVQSYEGHGEKNESSKVLNAEPSRAIAKFREGERKLAMSSN